MITLALVKFTKVRGNGVPCYAFPSARPYLKRLYKQETVRGKGGKHHSKLNKDETQHKSTCKHLTAQRGWCGPWRPALTTSGNTNQSVFHHLKLELLASSSVLFPSLLQKLLLELIYTICFYCWLRQFVPDCISTTLCVKLFCLNISESLNSGTHIGVVTGVILVCLAAGLTRALISPPLPQLNS